ncbi:MAG: hypothetical protein KGZ86_03080 [Candidatus Latescibacteria bacterium]|nr:hypothetical protein [Candidatus Latescibacterota bacterium]
MSNEQIICTPGPTPLHYADELTWYIEQASCAVSVLGDLLKDTREKNWGDGMEQSLGFC